MSELPVLVVSDVHLAPRLVHDGARALAALVRAHPGHELVLAGDVFDLSCDRPGTDPARTVAATLAEHADFARALRDHLGSGRVTFIAGNHDEAVTRPAVREAIRAALGVTETAPVDAVPWFVRRHGVHVEHGHLYDPDNAPSHPLAEWTFATEPLGVAITRHLVAPHGAYDFAHEHETTLTRGVRLAFARHGLRAPWLIAAYFAFGLRQCWTAGNHTAFAAEQARGNQELDAWAQEMGLAADELRALLAWVPRPTHHDRRSTFLRLYLDRSLAFCAAGAGLAALGIGMSAAAVPAVTLGVGYLGLSVVREASRYAGLTEQRLRDAAQVVMALTGARGVVLGHSHVEDADGGYLNLGSFAYPRGRRTYVVVSDTGLERRVVG